MPGLVRSTSSKQYFFQPLLAKVSSYVYIYIYRMYTYTRYIHHTLYIVNHTWYVIRCALYAILYALSFEKVEH